MKKLVMLLLLALPLAGFAQAEFPYSKMLYMTAEQVRDAKFKYDADKNQDVLRKTHGLQATVNVLSALSGTEGDIRPDVNDYQVLIQYGDEGIAFIEVTFYKDDTYHELLTFASDQGKDLLETSSGKLNKMQFNFDQYSFELSREIREIKTTTDRTVAKAKTFDQSYNLYRYVIITGKPASSPWLTKQAAKQEKRDDKGKKKKSVSDLM